MLKNQKICKNYLNLTKILSNKCENAKIWQMKNKKFTIHFRYLFYPFLAFLFGISVARGLYSGDTETFLVVIAILFGFGLFFIYKKKYKIMTLLFAFFFIGNGFFFLGSLTYSVKAYDGEVSIVGRVTDNFEETQYSYVVVLDDVSINGERTKNIRANISKGEQGIEVGDILTFESEVTPQSLFVLGSLNSTNYRLNVGYTLEADADDMIIVSGYKKFDETVRQSIKEIIYANMSEDNASIAYAVLFGDQSGISFEVNEAYRNSGIIHIIAVSGFNVSFLIAILYTAFSHTRMGRLASFIVTSIIIVLYAYFCGFAPSVVRASIMGIVFMSGKIFGKRYDLLNSLGLSGFIILFLNPLSAFDVGFLMSVGCVCGMVFLSPLFMKVLTKFSGNKVATYISASLSAQIAILPFLASFGSTVNLLSFIINLFVVPLFGLMYPYLFFMSFLALAMPFLGVLLLPVDWILTACYFIAYIFTNTSLLVKLYPLHLTTKVLFFLAIYTIGNFVIAKPIMKIMASVILLALCLCSVGVLDMSLNNRSSIVYTYSYGQESILLTSSSGQTVAVGENYLLSRAMDNYHIDKLDLYLTFDKLDENDVDQLEDYGFSYFFTTEGENFNDQIIVAEPSQKVEAGDFTFSYLSSEDEVQGLLISFDDMSVFVASEENFDYNNAMAYSNLLSSLNVDIAFVGEHYGIVGNDFISVSSVKNSHSTFNFIDDGNMLFSLGRTITKRSID
mgnify:FL=1